jgi:hypothetical protein
MNNRTETIKRIKTALQRRSGKAWSVTGGRGTARGWLTIDAPPARRTWGCRLKAGAMTDRPEDYEACDTGEPDRDTSPQDRAELCVLLGFDNDGRNVSNQGVSVPSSGDHYAEFIDRAEGRTPAKIAQVYWD